MSTPRQGDWMVTQSGRQVWPLDPRPEDFCIEDIAHGLSMVCRYGGHTREFYSVAQHSVLVSRIARHLVADMQLVDPGHSASEYGLLALFHDAAEAYVGDLVRPLKRSLPEYKRIEDGVLNAIAAAFDLDPQALCGPLIHQADNIALITERRDLLSSPFPQGLIWKEDERGVKAADWIRTIRPLDPVCARDAFLNCWKDLT